VVDVGACSPFLRKEARFLWEVEQAAAAQGAAAEDTRAGE